MALSSKLDAAHTNRLARHEFNRIRKPLELASKRKPSHRRSAHPSSTTALTSAPAASQHKQADMDSTRDKPQARSRRNAPKWFPLLRLLSLCALSARPVASTSGWPGSQAASFDQQFQMSPANLQLLSPATSSFVQLPASTGSALHSAAAPPTANDIHTARQLDLSQPADKTVAAAAAGSLAPVAKIIELVSTLASLPADQAQAASGPSAANSSSAQAAASATKAARVALQTIKPKKEPEANKQIAQLEQKIVSQHARAYHPPANYRPSAAGAKSHSSQQRIRANKQRDNILNSLLSSRDGSSVGAAGSSKLFDWPLQSVFDTLRSGVMKRSSIVKAMSDNRLARSRYRSPADGHQSFR